MRRMIDWIGKSAEDRGRDDDARRSAIERASGATERRTRPRRDPRRSRVDRGRRRTVSVSADVGPATSIPLILLMPPRGAKPCGLEAIDRSTESPPKSSRDDGGDAVTLAEEPDRPRAEEITPRTCRVLHARAPLVHALRPSRCG